MYLVVEHFLDLIEHLDRVPEAYYLRIDSYVKEIDGKKVEFDELLIIAGKVVYKGAIRKDSEYYDILMNKLDRKGIKISKILDKDGFLDYLRNEGII